MTIPLVVDLDGTLLRTDLLVESAIGAAKRQPLAALAMPVWLLRGKAYLKERLALSSSIDAATLPYDPAVVEWLKEEKAAGRRLVLATASHRLLADAVQSHLQLFDEVVATEGGVNLSRHRKRDALVAAFGEKGFDYAGNSRDDLAVWEAARQAHVVNPEAGVKAAAARLGNVASLRDSRTGGARAWLKALRLHQWAKNLLLFVPLLAAQQAGVAAQWLHGSLAFIFFGLCASSVYLLNDLLDLQEDRRHPTKHCRPLAAGTVSIKAAVIACPLLLLAAFAGSLTFLPWKFAVALAAYYALTLAYSLYLKQLMMVDVVVLALLYTQRLLAGTFAFSVAITFWMLAFSMFIFLSLALVKRHAELQHAKNRGGGKAAGRGYFADDLEMIASLGAASGYLAVLVLALYIQEKTAMALYHEPRFLWLACPLMLYWISRTWLITHRGEMHDDPVVFAIKDRVSLAIGAAFAVLFWLAR